jgi:hypothetical protein
LRDFYEQYISAFNARDAGAFAGFFLRKAARPRGQWLR